MTIPKKRPLQEIQEIDNLTPVAMNRARRDLIDDPKAQEAHRFSYHMDQLAIHAGLRLGKVDPTYKEKYGY